MKRPIWWTEKPTHEVTQEIYKLGADTHTATDYVLSPAFAKFLERYPLRRMETVYDLGLKVKVGRPKERFSSWYELFPRSTSPDIKRSGTFKDVENLLPRIQELGFDVLYMPPRTSRRTPQPERAQQCYHGPRGGTRQPVGDRIRGGRPQEYFTRARDHRRLQGAAGKVQGVRHGDRPRPGVSVCARPSLH